MYTSFVSEHLQLYKIICSHWFVLHSRSKSDIFIKSFPPSDCMALPLLTSQLVKFLSPLIGSTHRKYLRHRLVEFFLIYLLWVGCNGVHVEIRKQLAEDPCTSQTSDSDWQPWWREPSPSEPSGCCRIFQNTFLYTLSFITIIFYSVIIPIDKVSQLLSFFISGSSFIEGKSL